MITRRETRRSWYDHGLEFTGTRVVYKQRFDHGKDPNRYEALVREFLAGALHDEIRHAFGVEILDRIVDTVTTLVTGGPKLAEPPEDPAP